MAFFLPASVSQLISRLESAGYEAYAVGGCVRDMICGRTPHDWDLCTSAMPWAVSYTHLTLPTNSRV